MNSMDKARGIERLCKACRYSWQGLRAAWRHEAAFRQELGLIAILLPAALYLGETGLEKAVLLGAALPLLVAELLNSGLEALADHADPEPNELCGRAKDLASAAVLIALIQLIVVWLLVLLA